MSMKVPGIEVRALPTESVVPPANVNVVPHFKVQTELLLRQETAPQKWSVTNPFAHMAAEPVVQQKPVFVAQLKMNSTGPKNFDFGTDLGHVLNGPRLFLDLVPPTPALTFKVPETLVPLKQPVRDAVSKLLQTRPEVAKIVAESGNRVIQLPNAVEKDLLKYYQGQFETTRYFSPGTDLVQEIGLLQKPNSLSTLDTLQPAPQVSHALGEIYTDLTSGLNQKNDLLAHVFYPEQPQRSQLKITEPQNAALQSAFHEELAQQSTYVLGTLINLAQNVPSSEASLRYLAKGKVPIEIGVDDFVPGSSIQSKQDLYRVTEQKDGSLKIQLHSQNFQIPRLKELSDAEESPAPRQSPEEIYDENQKVIRQSGVDAMHVFASAVNDAEKIVRQKVGDAPVAANAQNKLDEFFSALEHQPVAYAVPNPRIAEAHNERGDLRTIISDALIDGEILDTMIQAAPPAARELLQQRLNRQFPELVPHISASSSSSAIDETPHPQENVALEDLDLNGFRVSEFSDFVGRLQSRLNVINNHARGLTSSSPR